MTEEDRTFEDLNSAADYLSSSKFGLDILHLALSKGEKGLTPTEAGRLLHRTVQMTSPVMQRLEAGQVLYSDKKGRSRRYFITSEELAEDFLANSNPKSRSFLGSALPTIILENNLEKILEHKCRRVRATLARNRELGTTSFRAPIPVHPSFTIVRNQKLNIVDVAVVNSPKDLMLSLGKYASLLAAKKLVNTPVKSIVLVLVLESTALLKELAGLKLDTIENSFSKVFGDIRLVLSDQTDTAIMSTDFAKKIAKGVWSKLAIK